MVYISNKFFIIADTHFNHENIIRFCNRPFKSIDEMNSYMIKAWNETVSNNDTVLVLGDFAFGNKEYVRELVNTLYGKKFLIMGNHDHFKKNVYLDMGFSDVSRFPILWNDFYLLSHDPLMLSETTPYFNYYGHVHNDEKYHDNATSKCVCVERIGYRPLQIM